MLQRVITFPGDTNPFEPNSHSTLLFIFRPFFAKSGQLSISRFFKSLSMSSTYIFPFTEWCLFKLQREVLSSNCLEDLELKINGKKCVATQILLFGRYLKLTSLR